MKVTKLDGKYTITHYDEKFVMSNLGELIAAKTALTDFIDKLAYASIIDFDSESDNDITITDAVKYASSRGHELGRRSVQSAIEAGTIEATKIAGRLVMKEKSFLAWYGLWEGKKRGPE